MGKRGPQPQPAELKQLRGNPGKRPINDPPKSEAMVPECPEELSHLAEQWNHYGKILADLGILRETDTLAWESLWRTWERYLGAIKEGKNELQYLGMVIKLLDHFGMSPSSRSSLVVEAPKAPDEFSEFLKRVSG